MLEASEACLTYPNGVEALKDINIFMDQGEFVFLMGTTGSGKSSLLKLFYRDEVPTSGEVYVNNHDITELPRNRIYMLRRKVGVVFQDFKLLDYKTVRENVSYALEVTGYQPKKIAEKVDMVLDIVGLMDKKDRYPDELSGGEKQLTSIARALVYNPPVLLADEPTGNLDSVSADNVMKILEYINSKGTTVVVATHNQEIVKKMNKRVITLKKGKIISDEGGANPDMEIQGKKITPSNKMDLR
ncbi:MAG: cell division ATP-binding protein FtsE [Vulcanimicrobiota bacterium]